MAGPFFFGHDNFPDYRAGNEPFNFRVMTGMQPFARRWLFAGLMALSPLALAQSAAAQTPNYSVQTMNFDMWCQETAHLAPERCDKRQPEDVQTFETFRAQIEAYEIPYLQDKKNQINLNNNILHQDPTVTPDAQIQSGQQQRNPTIDTRTTR
jgi:hypothetical protein